MARIFTLLAAAFAGVGTPALAQLGAPIPTRVDAGTLVRLCAQDTAPCLGYIVGVADSYASALAASNRLQVFCIPPTATNEQIRQAALRYLTAHPEQAGANAALVVLSALRAAYPCAQ